MLSVPPSEKSIPPSRWQRTELAAIFIPFLAAAFALQGLLQYWDDGAITAAFARTYAVTGKLH
jgi:hypothetical protein